jgi:Ca-activated chloride channel homolog
MSTFNIAIWNYSYYAPNMLYLLIGVPVLIFLWDYFHRKDTGQLKFTGSDTEQLSIKGGNVILFRWLIAVLYGLGLLCFVTLTAKPYHPEFDPPKIDYKNGIDIILAIDASGSMMAEDLTPNRLEATKKVAKEFVDSRKGDRVGLVVFEGEAYSACPATIDYEALKQQITDIQPGRVDPGTAIGMGLGVAVTRLRSDSLKSKVIILLTDGMNNAGTIEPMEAAQLAKNKNCRVYTIGAGSNGGEAVPINTPFGMQYTEVEIDEVTLKAIADRTGGKYFRATDTESLSAIYNEIDKLEKRKIESDYMGAQPPLTLFPFFFWGILFSLAAWSIQHWKFKLDD